ncbi:MAG: hypothetical protein OEQ18_04980 [Gammaproteobacteria bacterium]|nr:hypothetical protein [Gammaproteobacteria bacterium]
MSERRTLSVVESPYNGEAVLDGNQPSLVPNGKYQLSFLYHETKLLHGGASKLVTWFRIADPGPYHGAKLARYYNVQKFVEKPGKNGGFKAGWKSDVVVNKFRTLC